VPLVGSVPLIGHLFKRTAVNVNTQELLFFITPRVQPG
jgi:type II secretory pathway component GspD/PulD (secretin)